MTNYDPKIFKLICINKGFPRFVFQFHMLNFTLSYICTRIMPLSTIRCSKKLFHKNHIMRKSFFKITAALFLSVAFMLNVSAEEDVRLLRFPDINNDLIAFVYAGDIWTVNANGGDATRLTSHKGMELFPKISPDGQWIAFSAEYSGSRQIYVMPAKGGTPKQLTWYNSVGLMPPRGGFDNIVLDWTPDSKKIMVRMNRTPFGQRNGKYFLVSIDGGFEEPLEITDGGFGVLSPDGNQVAFAHIAREFRDWKRYKGGRAADVWIYDLKNSKAEKITKFVGSDQIPSWYGDKIYFASDRDLRLNIFSYDVNTKQMEKITNHEEFDVLWPSGDNGQIAYENGGFIYKLNLATNQTEKITVNIHFDNPNLLPYYKNVKDDISTVDVSPTGKRALFDARGDIFSVPAKDGEIKNLTNTQGVRETGASWSPNGKEIAYVSDATGEYELYLLENKAGAAARQITSGSSAWFYDLVWSPNSKMIAFSDRTLQLKYIDVNTGVVKVVDKATENEIRGYSFSPDSKWITYIKESENSHTAVWVYNTHTGETKQLTTDEFSDFSPVFSKDGKYLYFMSNRNYNLNFSSHEFAYLYNRATRIFALALTHESPVIFKHKEDVEAVKAEEKAPTPEKSKKKKGKAAPAPKKDNKEVKIDFDNIRNRIIVMPMRAGNYRNLTAVDGGFIYIAGGSLKKYKLGDEKESNLMDGIRYAIPTADGKSMLYAFSRDFAITKLGKGKAGTGKLDLSDMEMKIEPKKEWNQIYWDAWRIYRDYFYVSNLHNVDWKAEGDRYAQLLRSVSHRMDLDYILSEMVAESNAGHAYINFGDFEKVERRETGLLGAELAADYDAGMYKITKIYQGENWTPNRRSPLTEQGVKVNVGDYIVKINGQNVSTKENPYMYLENTIGKVVELTVSSKADGSGAKTYKIKPINSEMELRYLDWVESRRAMVDKLSGGKIGYIHVPNTAVEGNRELYRGMYAYHTKEALIIDDRYNGGGFIPWQMAELLDRYNMSYWHRKDMKPMKFPNVAHEGPKAMLINYYSSSGGDAFPHFFRKLGLGKLIGTRTWGGLVGISGNAGLIDGTSMSVPRFGIYDESGWIIEGIGVYPDIEVYDRPDSMAKGIDPGIEAAVKHLLEELKKPQRKVEKPADPDRKEFIEIDIK